jgi:DNA topoisomerase I
MSAIETLNPATQRQAIARAEEPARGGQDHGLVHVDDSLPGITRRRTGTGFAYYDQHGRLIRDARTLRKLRALAVPPAYADVWICPNPNGHIQATGRDERGRKQYTYHPDWRQMAEEAKYEHMLDFAASLPKLRRGVVRDMALSGLPRRKVLATIVSLLEKTLIRVGNDEYAKENKSYGLTTLRNRHVRINGQELRFNFTGKSGKPWRVAVGDRRVARIVRACQELPGQHLFQYLDDEGETQAVTSSDVNAYLRELTGRDITAKDFRTWAGTVLAAHALSELEAFDSLAAAKRSMRGAVEKVAMRLGNTPTICRKCYVHPEVFTAYLDGELLLNVRRQIRDELRSSLKGFSAQEGAVPAFLQERLARNPARRRSR